MRRRGGLLLLLLLLRGHGVGLGRGGVVRVAVDARRHVMLHGRVKLLLLLLLLWHSWRWGRGRASLGGESLLWLLGGLLIRDLEGWLARGG